VAWARGIVLLMPLAETRGDTEEVLAGAQRRGGRGVVVWDFFFVSFLPLFVNIDFLLLRGVI